MRRVAYPLARGLLALVAVGAIAIPSSHAAATTAAPAAAASAAPAASGGDLGEPSAAERVLFMRPHLASIREPRTVSYDYVAEIGAAPRATDHASLVLGARKDGACCTTHVDFLSGPSAIVLPDLDDPQGNPVLMYFLENEVRILERTTHGQSAHFRRRIRQALASDATVRDASVRWEGKDVPAQVVHVAPFVNDPYRVRFEHAALTEYTFVMADAVPGGIVRLSALVPAGAASDAAKAERTLSIADPQPAAPARK